MNIAWKVRQAGPRAIRLTILVMRLLTLATRVTLVRGNSLILESFFHFDNKLKM
jgi:hypothetical protein